MESLRIIIAGTRTFSDYELLKKSFMSCIGSKREYSNNIKIVSGTANGADKLGEEFAKRNNLKVAHFPAKWNEYGKKAGYMRNREMAKYAIQDGCKGILLAFWDGKSKGTESMIHLAKQYGLKVHVVRYDNVERNEPYQSKTIPTYTSFTADDEEPKCGKCDYFSGGFDCIGKCGAEHGWYGYLRTERKE